MSSWKLTTDGCFSSGKRRCREDASREFVEREHLRVGFVVGQLARGGAELQLTRLAGGLAERGHEVAVIAYDGPGALDGEMDARSVDLTIETVRTQREKLVTVRRWLKAQRLDVVHGVLNRASALTLLARFPARWPAAVATDFSSATYGMHDPILRASLVTFALADRVVTESELNLSNLGRRAPWLRRKAVVLRNGVDTVRFHPAVGRRESAKGIFVFCVVGTVHAVKNPLRVVDAVIELKRRGHVGFRVDWYGRLGLNSDDDTGDRAVAQTVAGGIAEHLVFHGESPSVDVAYRESDTLLHASVREGFPNAVAEAMASGLPILVSRVSDLPRVVAEARNGFVFDETNASAIADAMERMMSVARSERDQMGRRSRELAIRWFGSARYVEEHESLYHELITKKR